MNFEQVYELPPIPSSRDFSSTLFTAGGEDEKDERKAGGKDERKQ